MSVLAIFFTLVGLAVVGALIIVAMGK